MSHRAGGCLGHRIGCMLPVTLISIFLEAKPQKYMAQAEFTCY